jgi:uncharacterized membrane protein YfcA
LADINPIRGIGAGFFARAGFFAGFLAGFFGAGAFGAVQSGAAAPGE